MKKEKIYKNLLQVLFFSAFVSPLVVNNNLFFPYVTGSALFFRLVVETLFSLWLIFILIYPRHRPRRSLLIGAVGVYIVALTAATVFSANPFASFWGDTERMMGLFGILHFFTLFFIGTSLFRGKKELYKVLYVYLAVSLVISVYGILQRFGLTGIKPNEIRIVAMLGNAAVLSAYLIFGLFWSIYLALKNSNIYLKVALAATALTHLIAIYFAGTRGAYLGIMAGLLAAGLIISFKYKQNKKIKATVIFVLATLCLVYGTLFIFQEKISAKNHYYLYRLTHFSLADSTAQTRLMSWQSGLKGFLDKPLLGYGLENFAIPFNKYFQAKYYDLAPTQPYFDRAHNVIIELLATTGLVGLASYLLVFAAIIYSLIKTYKRDNDYIYLGVFGGLVIAYFVQNLLFFDMLPAMIGFMVLLIFINNNHGTDENKITEEKRGLRVEYIVLIAVLLLSGLYYSYKNLIYVPYQALKHNVLGQIYYPSDHDKGLSELKKSVSYQTPFDLDLRSSAANTIFNYYISQSVPGPKSEIDFAAELYRENLKYLPRDTYYNYKIGEILNYRFALDLDENVNKEARKYLEKAINTSPKRAKIYYLLAENYLMGGELEKAVETDEFAVSLNDKFGESYWELAKVYYILQNFDKAKENLAKTVEHSYRISEDSMLKFAPLYNLESSTDNEIIFYELVIKNGTKNYIFYTTLANRYFELKNKEKAIYYAQGALKLNPEIKDQVEGFIKKANELP